MNFQLVPKSVTSNDLERRNGPSIALFYRVNATYVTYLSYRQRSHVTPCLISPRISDSPYNYLFTARSDINQFRIIVIVTNYIDISRKINYNGKRQFGRLIGTIISLCVHYYTSGILTVGL